MTAASKDQLAFYKEGVYLTATSGLSLEDLRHEATADRLRLAEHFLDSADRMMRTRPPQHRNAISRYYYSIYHVLRAVVYFSHEGADHEAPATLPANAAGRIAIQLTMIHMRLPMPRFRLSPKLSPRRHLRF